MATCAYCGMDIIFGGVRVGELRYCRRACQQQAEEADSNIRQAKRAYERHLSHLRENSANPQVRQQALEAGRAYAAWRRHREGGKVTAYDEIAIANEIEAATAVGAVPNTLSTKPAMSVEERLERLTALKSKKLISEEEYEAKRAAILAEL